MLTESDKQFIVELAAYFVGVSFGLFLIALSVIWIAKGFIDLAMKFDLYSTIKKFQERKKANVFTE